MVPNAHAYEIRVLYHNLAVDTFALRSDVNDI